MCNRTIQVNVADVAASETAAAPQLIDDLVTANHILFDQGVVDAFGHVSVRHDKDPEHFLLSCNMAPGQVSAQDIVEFNLDGEPLNAKGRKVYLERFIHSEIYRAWPEVTAIVHSHSHAIVPFTVAKKTALQAMFHMAGFIGESVPVFEIRDVVGTGSDLLISDQRLGKALAACFNNSHIALMRGHGSTVVAESLHKAVYRAVYADMNARYQSTALQLGEITYLTAEECQACVTSIEGQVKRPWDLWKQQAAEKRGQK